MPFVPFPRQVEMIAFLHACVDGQQSGLIEKARDMGATWLACAFSVWLWLYRPGAAIGWGSRKEQLVDKIGDPTAFSRRCGSSFGRRAILPTGFDPRDDMPSMKIVNRATGATITGESGDNIGARRTQADLFQRRARITSARKIEAAAHDTTNVQVDMSSVNGPGNVFHRRRESGIEWAPGAPPRSTAPMYS